MGYSKKKKKIVTEKVEDMEFLGDRKVMTA